MVLLIGSAPDAVQAKDWDLSVFAQRVAINNAWQITPDWDYLVYPEDFAPERLPPTPLKPSQQLIAAPEFVPQQNHFGGFVYAGGTMAFTAGYWALGALKPDLMAFLGCDMVYDATSGESSHFYGQGTPDPLRVDVTLQSLEAKSARFMALAQAHGCAVVNLSELPESRLLFPRVASCDVTAPGMHQQLLQAQSALIDPAAVARALQAEQDLGYMVPSGRYWEHTAEFDKTKLSDIDSLWLQVIASDQAVTLR
ncbi:hypothetical protein [Limnohabitans sp. TEGF004]|uniref:hypothetical protein n=1 Tax=Limnohabitans sp. TEGF004 TaxID=2986281 RepID=UPI00237754CB|nr:hypothetical protein [Limnohabitans sp. TEGF004]BDU55782.1 hypothetical protein LTEGF4_14630 [Limnohabitans sp. TEGF004]